MSAENSGLRRTLARNMNARADKGEGFPQQIPIDPIKLPAQLAIPGSLELKELHCDDGWLIVAWALPAGN